jgi:hypothetical protein
MLDCVRFVNLLQLYGNALPVIPGLAYADDEESGLECARRVKEIIAASCAAQKQAVPRVASAAPRAIPSAVSSPAANEDSALARENDLLRAEVRLMRDEASALKMQLEGSRAEARALRNQLDALSRRFAQVVGSAGTSHGAASQVPVTNQYQALPIGAYGEINLAPRPPGDEYADVQLNPPSESGNYSVFNSEARYADPSILSRIHESTQ